METTLRTSLIPIRYDESKAVYPLHASSDEFRMAKISESFEVDLARIMQQVARFCMRVDQARYGNPIDGIGVKPLAVQRVWC